MFNLIRIKCKFGWNAYLCQKNLLYMEIDKYFIWACIGFSEAEFPHIYCPNCDTALRYNRDSLIQLEITKSNESIREYVFTCNYDCPSCNKPVMMTGTGGCQDPESLKTLGYYHSSFVEYSPLFFYPTIHLFRIHSECPEKVRHEIIQSFSLFWNDVSSCANKLRVSLELLMDVEGIAYTSSSFDKPQKMNLISLHRRIEQFKERNQEIGNILDVIRKIGNKGSHADEKMIVNEVIHAYKLLEKALNELYESE